MEYAISLHKYYKKLVDRQDLQSSVDDPIPPIPPIPEIIKKYEKNALNFSGKEIK